MAQYWAKVYVDAPDSVTPEQLTDWLAQACVLDIDAETYPPDFEHDGFAIGIEWSTIRPSVESVDIPGFEESDE